MTVQLRCIYGDLVAGIFTPCQRAATGYVRDPKQPMRNEPCCTEHRDQLTGADPDLVVLEIG